MQTLLPILLPALLAGMVALYYYREHVHERKLALRVRKLFASQLFEDMLPLLCSAKYNPVESLFVDKAGVSVRYLHSQHPENCFCLNQRGYDNLSTEKLEALRVLLEQCLPKLADHKLYGVFRKPTVCLNGTIEYAFEYTMTHSYKTSLSRSAYYNDRQ